MQSLLTLKQNDDPHDVVAVAPDAVRVVPSDVAPPDDELSNLLHLAARHRSEAPPLTAPDFAAGSRDSKILSATSPTVPPVDTTFRPTAVDGVAIPRKGGATVRRAVRAFMTLLLAACIGVIAFAWRSYGDTAERKIGKWATQFVLTASPPAEKPVSAAPTDAQADAANAAPPQLAPSALTAPEAVAPNLTGASPESTQLLQSMARDLASLGQQVEQLKASVEQLKAGQQQISARNSEQNPRAPEPNLRPKTSAASATAPTSALPPRPVARVHRPPPQAALAPPLRQTAAPYPTAAPYYAPRPPEPPPQTMEPLPDDPGVSSIPRPPMPLR